MYGNWKAVTEAEEESRYGVEVEWNINNQDSLTDITFSVEKTNTTTSSSYLSKKKEEDLHEISQGSSKKDILQDINSERNKKEETRKFSMEESSKIV